VPGLRCESNLNDFKLGGETVSFRTALTSVSPVRRVSGFHASLHRHSPRSGGVLARSRRSSTTEPQPLRMSTIPRLTGGSVELLGIELLEEHARRLAALISIAPVRRRDSRSHLRRLSDHMRALRAIYAALSDDARREAVSPAAEWLLDNFHVVSAASRDIQHDLPASFFRRLPRVASDEFAGLPRIYALAIELIGSSAGRLESQRLQRFIAAFQSIAPLTIGELWA